MTNTARQWLWEIISGGLPPDHDLEVIRKMLLLNLLVIVGGSFLLLFSITAFVQGYYLLGAADFAVLLFLLALFLFLRKTKNHSLVSKLGVVATGCFFSFLVAYGGIGNSAFLWAFTFPLVSLFLVGSVLGTILTFSLLAVACIVFVVGMEVHFLASYSADMAYRFIGAYTSVFLFALAMEQVRVMVQKRLGKANRKLEESIALLNRANSDKQQLIEDLQQSLDEVSTLQGILPICASCKKIRDDHGYWERVEKYIEARSKAAFSHGICPDCAKTLYPDVSTGV